jgi:hypothetical protein
MYKILAAVALAANFALALPAYAQTIMDLINTDLQFCNKPKLLDGSLQGKGSWDSGNPEFWIVDFGKIDCDGHKRTYCGSAGCLVQIYTLHQSGKYERIMDTHVRDYRFVQVNGQPAITMTLHGSACGLIGSDVCIKTVGLGPRQ